MYGFCAYNCRVATHSIFYPNLNFFKYLALTSLLSRGSGFKGVGRVHKFSVKPSQDINFTTTKIA